MSGHGWVVARPDGVVARCGGPALCSECRLERGRVDSINKTLAPLGIFADTEKWRAPRVTHHELKTWPAPFAAIRSGHKRYEIRKADRDFKVGDTLDLREWDPDRGDYTGESWSDQISYVSEPGTWGLPADLCVFGLAGVRR